LQNHPGSREIFPGFFWKNFIENFTGIFLGKYGNFFQRGKDRGVSVLNALMGSFAFPVAL
jgi:hypothetical protein